MAWQLQEAKARFSQFLDATLREGPQIVTRHGKEEAVLVPIDEWKRLQRKDPKAVLLASTPIVEDMMIPKRGSYKHRKSPVV
ncbi:type II toxin-antitoxin system Phd/YefM family antitoxin [soil metagenome]